MSNTIPMPKGYKFEACNSVCPHPLPALLKDDEPLFCLSNKHETGDHAVEIHIGPDDEPSEIWLYEWNEQGYTVEQRTG